jgi:hypothetical protein
MVTLKQPTTSGTPTTKGRARANVDTQATRNRQKPARKEGRLPIVTLEQQPTGACQWSIARITWILRVSLIFRNHPRPLFRKRAI